MQPSLPDNRNGVPSVTVIVPLHRRTPAFERCVESAARIACAPHSVIVVSDRDPGDLPADVKLVLTGSPANTSPAEKRDVALEHVTSEICAFLDDDAYPGDDWLERALEHFGDGLFGRRRRRTGDNAEDSTWRRACVGCVLRVTVRQRATAVPIPPPRPRPGRRRPPRLQPVHPHRRTAGDRGLGQQALRRRGHLDLPPPRRGRLPPGLRPRCRRLTTIGALFSGHTFARSGTSAATAATSRASSRRRPAGRCTSRPTARLLATTVLAVAALRDKRARAVGVAAGIATWSAIARRAREDGCDLPTAGVLPAVVAASHAVYGFEFARGFFTPSIEEM